MKDIKEQLCQNISNQIYVDAEFVETKYTRPFLNYIKKELIHKTERPFIKYAIITNLLK